MILSIFLFEDSPHSSTQPRLLYRVKDKNMKIEEIHALSAHSLLCQMSDEKHTQIGILNVNNRLRQLNVIWERSSVGSSRIAISLDKQMIAIHIFPWIHIFALNGCSAEPIFMEDTQLRLTWIGNELRSIPTVDNRGIQSSWKISKEEPEIVETTKLSF